MTQQHPDLPEEQAYIDHAYDCLNSSREAAWRMRDMTEADLGGTFQARFERNAFDEALVKRLTDLDLGNASLVFGRIDRYAESPDALESFHIGRLAVADESREPIVVDWRAPVAEPFYRATGRDAMGLARRRHFAVEGQQLLGIEDELFGEGHLGVGHDEGLDGSPSTDRMPEIRGYSTLLASLERGRTGTLGDIVATIQGEQDEIIRSPQAGVLVVQGGPGTGKTVVALHRAAYLLYTHRFPLEDQGVLVIGPNRVFLRYIERVLPSLGEAGIEQVVLADLVPDVQFLRPGDDGDDWPEAARLKGDPRMSDVIDQAISDRQRPLRHDLVLPFRTGYVRLRADESARIVRTARRRFRRHNSGRRYVESELWAALAGDVGVTTTSAPRAVRDTLRGTDEVRAALDRMWPVLTPAQLLHDLFGSKALLKSAGRGVLDDHEALLLFRERSERVDDVRWTPSDVALLDDARDVLGPRLGKNGKVDEYDEIRTYGHIVIDEVQDLTPMQLKMATRRSLSGSMTIVGDIAQATGPLAPDGWDDVLELPARSQAGAGDRAVGRLPHPAADHAARRPGDGVRHAVAAAAAVGQGRRLGSRHRRAPSPGRAGGHGGDRGACDVDALPNGSLGVVAPDQLIPELSACTHGGRHRPRHGDAHGPRCRGHARARQRRQGSRTRRRGRGRTDPDRERSRAGHALAVRRAHPLHPTAHGRPRRPAARTPPLNGRPSPRRSCDERTLHPSVRSLIAGT